jgi:hypothetical protein
MRKRKKGIEGVNQIMVERRGRGRGRGRRRGRGREERTRGQ